MKLFIQLVRKILQLSGLPKPLIVATMSEFVSLELTSNRVKSLVE